MHDSNTQLKDLTEMEKLLIGSAINLTYNLLNNQLNHIENHDPELLELLATSERAQKDFILLKNCREVSLNLCLLFGKILCELSKEKLESILEPGLRLESFLKEIFDSISCGPNN